MPKLFVALPVPEACAARIAAIQPRPQPGIRLPAADQMHITLHYLGEMEEPRAQRVSEALATIRARPFSLALAGVGWFPPAKDASTLYAGVLPSAALHELHALIAQALAPEGFQPEPRPYTPHVTLARCSTEVPAALMDELLQAHRDFEPEPIWVQAFGLYSTAWQEGTPQYRLERTYRLERILGVE